MKKPSKEYREFDVIRRQYRNLRALSAHTKAKHLWQHEAAVREKIKTLNRLRGRAPGDFDAVYNRYIALLEDLSRRMLDDYNHRQGTSFQFEEVVEGRFKAYRDAGVLAVLMTHHIPRLFSEAFGRLLPDNPRDEYPEARAMRRSFHLHLGDTNTGKTYDAVRRLMAAGQGVYLAPLRILALENCEFMNISGAPCNLLTGEEEIWVQGAQLTSCTTEKLNLSREYKVAVIDEVQLMADPQRGAAWTRAILGLRCPEIHVCGALNALEQLTRMIEGCGDTWTFTRYERKVPLKIMRRPVTLNAVRPGDALVAFSKKRVIALSEALKERGIQTAVIYGDLPPEVRRMQCGAFIRGERPVLVATDAIGMGVNLPIRRILFAELSKYDGEHIRPLTAQEVKQIAGRAGRLGIYDVGYVGSLMGEHELLEACLAAEDEPIEQAIVGPSEAMLPIEILPLREKLALWSTREENLPYYRKMDVRDLLVTLDRVAAYHLPEPIQWQLMMLPFDAQSENRMAQLLSYVETVFVRHESRIPVPELEKRDLSALEGYYQAVNLYYSFSRAFSLPLDEAWVNEARRYVSASIDRHLNRRQKEGLK